MLERIGWVYSTTRDGVHLSRLTADIGDFNVPQLAGPVQRHKDGAFTQVYGTEMNAGYSLNQSAFKALERIEAGDKKRGKRRYLILILFRCMDTQIQRLVLKSEAGICGCTW